MLVSLFQGLLVPFYLFADTANRIDITGRWLFGIFFCLLAVL